mmetsp:Transcript_1015/g.2883  ORF Transcript_1015/g.2883 Transcript_1015/m.2883 type:complete len:263 (-) Transcript_1015:274-1062(-)
MLRSLVLLQVAVRQPPARKRVFDLAVVPFDVPILPALLRHVQSLRQLVIVTDLAIPTAGVVQLLHVTPHARFRFLSVVRQHESSCISAPVVNLLSHPSQLMDFLGLVHKLAERDLVCLRLTHVVCQCNLGDSIAHDGRHQSLHLHGAVLEEPGRLFPRLVRSLDRLQLLEPDVPSIRPVLLGLEHGLGVRLPGCSVPELLLGLVKQKVGVHPRVNLLLLYLLHHPFLGPLRRDLRVAQPVELLLRHMTFEGHRLKARLWVHH